MTSIVKAKKKGRDIVKVDVGGRIFTAAKSTLVFSSNYFASIFKDEWQQGADDGEDGEDIPYIDQDPDDFAVLLGFMRRGFIEQSKLTVAVIFLADFLGVDALLTSVRSTAYRCMNPLTLCRLSDQEACHKFDEKYGGIEQAIKGGILPKAVKREGEIAVEQYAYIIVYKTMVRDPVLENSVYETYYTQLWVQSRSLPPDNVSPRPYLVPDCHTYLEAENWLAKGGFDRVSDDGQPKDNLGNRSCPFHATGWYSRPIKRGEDGNAGIQTNNSCIVFDNECSVGGDEDKVGECKVPPNLSVFAAVIKRVNLAGLWEFRVLVDSETDGRKGLLDVHSNQTFSSRMTEADLSFATFQQASSFLNSKGYMQFIANAYEPFLETLQRYALNITNPELYKVSIFSRPVKSPT